MTFKHIDFFIGREYRVNPASKHPLFITVKYIEDGTGNKVHSYFIKADDMPLIDLSKWPEIQANIQSCVTQSNPNDTTTIPHHGYGNQFYVPRLGTVNQLNQVNKRL